MAGSFHAKQNLMKPVCAQVPHVHIDMEDDDDYDDEEEIWSEWHGHPFLAVSIAVELLIVFALLAMLAFRRKSFRKFVTDWQGAFEEARKTLSKLFPARENDKLLEAEMETMRFGMSHRLMWIYFVGLLVCILGHQIRIGLHSRAWVTEFTAWMSLGHFGVVALLLFQPSLMKYDAAYVLLMAFTWAYVSPFSAPPHCGNTSRCLVFSAYQLPSVVMPSRIWLVILCNAITSISTNLKLFIVEGTDQCETGQLGWRGLVDIGTLAFCLIVFAADTHCIIIVK